jgi:hypothetical protein
MHDPVFSRANVVVATMDEALSAITLFRTGAGARTVGDWSQIVGEFDRYRDGQAAVRLKERIRAVSSTTSAAREVSREAVGITS